MRIDDVFRAKLVTKDLRAVLRDGDGEVFTSSWPNRRNESKEPMTCSCYLLTQLRVLPSTNLGQADGGREAFRGRAGRQGVHRRRRRGPPVPRLPRTNRQYSSASTIKVMLMVAYLRPRR